MYINYRSVMINIFIQFHNTGISQIGYCWQHAENRASHALRKKCFKSFYTTAPPVFRLTKTAGHIQDGGRMCSRNSPKSQSGFTFVTHLLWSWKQIHEIIWFACHAGKYVDIVTRGLGKSQLSKVTLKRRAEQGCHMAESVNITTEIAHLQ